MAKINYMNKALFLDRDGVINVEKNYVYRIEDFEFIDGIFELCHKYIDHGFLILVITNQAGIAKGFYSVDDFLKLTDWMIVQFRKKRIDIKKVYYCPHFPDVDSPCECRKPNPGMILRAANEFDLDLTQCVLIGDKESDLQAGRNAGMKESNLHLV
jgi:D-glycero-D-manno-heptose 1,7-bisphosphate phosphatase